MKQIETELLIMTEEDKNVLERILKALNISLTDFVELRNVKKNNEALLAKIEEQEKKITDLENGLKNFGKNLIQLNNRLSNVENGKANDKIYSDLMDLLQGDDSDDSDD